MKNWGDELPEAISKTIKYYRNDVERLAIDWEEYHQTALNVASNIQAYTKSTGQIKQTDVEKLESISSAFQVLPENLQSTDKQPEFTPLVAQTLPPDRELGNWGDRELKRIPQYPNTLTPHFLALRKR